MTNNKKFNLFKVLICILLISIVIVFAIYYFSHNKNDVKKKSYYLSSNIFDVNTYDENFKVNGTLKRGSKVIKESNKVLVDKDKKEYIKIKYDDKSYIILSDNLVDNEKKIATEDKVFVRTATSIYSDYDSSEIIGLAKKGDELSVLEYNKVLQNGVVDRYKVSYGDITGYVYGKYLVFDKDSALAFYEQEKYHDLHATRGDNLGAGNAGNLDYYPVDKPKFKDNKMPDVVYALYLNGGKDVISRVDEYIEFAKGTKINSFVVDIKDNEAPAYSSDVMREYSPTNYAKAANSKEDYKNAIQKIKDAGFYVIGRITAFKDKYYATDHPDNAIMDTRTGGPYLHADTYWPSPFKRGVWMFNVELAKESVKDMGFNEIQFDYVRFPDRVLEYERKGLMDFRNDYGEEKAQAIQRVLMYATDELHKLNVYVSADVFGESAHEYVTAYGQYWSSISNVVDVISAMPYPDHVSKYEYGFKEPVWTKPYDILNFWAKTYVVKRQAEIPTPAIARTWVQTYDVPNYKQPGGYKYGAEQVNAQIQALFDNGLNGGYMTWNSSSNLEKYKSQIDAYNKEYK